MEGVTAMIGLFNLEQMQDERADYYEVNAAAHAPFVFCDDMTVIDVDEIWHSYVVYPPGERLG